MNGQAIAALAVASAAALPAPREGLDPALVGPERLARIAGEARFAAATADRATAQATRP